MSQSKKARLICILIGLILILVSVLSIVLTAKTAHYTATVTEITKTYTTRASGKRNKIRYNEDVSVIFVKDNGDQKEADGVRIKRNTKNQLPAVGDTIEVKDGLTGVKEFTSLTAFTAAGAMIFVGLLFIIVSFRVGRKKKEPVPDQMP